MKANIYINTEIDITGIIENLPDEDRIEWVRVIVSTVTQPGTVKEIRDLVNNPLLDD